MGVDRDEQTALVAGDPFRYVRNPFFTALLAAAAGLVIVAPTFVGIGGWLLLMAASELQVRVVEEPYLSTSLGDVYLRYASATGRFVPRLGRLHLPGGR